MRRRAAAGGRIAHGAPARGRRARQPERAELPCDVRTQGARRNVAARRVALRSAASVQRVLVDCRPDGVARAGATLGSERMARCGGEVAAQQRRVRAERELGRSGGGRVRGAARRRPARRGIWVGGDLAGDGDRCAEGDAATIVPQLCGAARRLVEAACGRRRGAGLRDAVRALAGSWCGGACERAGCKQRSEVGGERGES